MILDGAAKIGTALEAAQPPPAKSLATPPPAGRFTQQPILAAVKRLTLLAVGFSRAIALTVLHETARHLRPQHAPRMDVRGMRGLRELFGKSDLLQPDDDTLFDLTMAGDVLSNRLYHSLIGGGRQAVRRGLLLGVARVLRK